MDVASESRIKKIKGWVKLKHVVTNCISVFASITVHPPLKGVLALWSEVVDVRLEVEFEDVVLVDVFWLRWDGDRVAQQREARQRVVILHMSQKRETSVNTTSTIKLIRVTETTFCGCDCTNSI